MAEDIQSSRRLPACERCRIRKTKCDSQIPSCTNCTKAGVECMNKDKVLGKIVSRSYVWSLEERIRVYEGMLQSSEQNEEPRNKRAKLSDKNKDSSLSQTPPQLPQISLTPPVQNQQQSNSSRSFIDRSPISSEDDETVARNTMDSLLTSNFSGGIATLVSDDLDDQIRQYSSPSSRQSAREIFIEKENVAIAKIGRDFLKQYRRNIPKNRTTDISAYDHNILTRVAKRYFTWMNSAHPVLHECMFHLQLEKCRENQEEASVIDSFQVNMVMAISLASVMRSNLSNSEIGRIANDFWKSATKLRDQVLFGTGIKKLQNILLLLQYTLLVPKAGNLWQLSGSAMRFATEMGLYTEPNPSQEFDPLSLDLRRRIFWTCYCIDRILATVMGRPTGIPDSWISAKYPVLVEDRLVTFYGIERGPICHLKVAQIQQIRILRLQSEIHQFLYAPANANKLRDRDMIAWSWQMYDQLRLWRGSFKNPTPLITKEWTELQFHIAVVLLFRPSPNRSKLSNEALHVAFHSAGEVMKLVKIMHRECSAVFSWLTVQNLFMCGLTFVNSLKELTENRNSHNLCISFVEVFLLIQSCTAMLETLSALEAGANDRIRNAFEMISSNVLQNITQTAPSLSQQASHGQCIWNQIAKLDDISMERPVQIEGTSIPIQGNCPILQQTDMQSWERTSEMFGDEHFSEHDVDASTRNRMLDTPFDKSLYTIVKGRYSFYNPLNNENLNNEGSAPDPTTAETASRMERLVAMSNIAADAEPIRDTSGLPEWSETNLGAELERWFLYPLPEASERFII